MRSLSPMSNNILFEDRSEETPQQQLERRIIVAGQMMIHVAIQASQGSPEIGLNALALALGQGAARVGAPIEDILASVRRYYEGRQSEVSEVPTSVADA